MNPIVIDHFSRRKEFIQMLREREAWIGAEIGTDRGQYAQQLLEGIPGLKLYCIDPWLAYTEGKDVKTQEDVDQIFSEASRRLEPYKDVVIVRKTSMEAVKDIEDELLDFVFIDGNHNYEHVLEDITEWTKKVRPGGIVCGHDYKEDAVNGYGVIEAVQKYTKDNHISPWFILRAGGKLVDCWMFIKS